MSVYEELRQFPDKGRYGCVSSAKSRSRKIFQKPHNPFRVGSQNLVIEQVLINVRVQKSEFFCKYATSCSLFHKILHFLSKRIKNVLAKFSSQLNLMTGKT